MSKEHAILEWQKLLDAKQTVRRFRNALAGDGGGTVDVTGEPGYIWCRYSADQSKVSKVFNIIAPGLPEDFPIVVGRRFPTDEFEQVLAVNWTLYQDIISQDTVDNFTTGNHGESHNAASGADPAPIDLRNIVEMRGRAQAVANLTVDVERGQYVFGYDDVRRFPGEMIDLTASVPGVAGHRFVLVYVDGVTNALGSEDGAIVPLAAAAPIPDITANTIPVCLVDLENGQTTIVEDDIYDWRFLWDLVSWNAPWLIGTNAERLVLVVGDLAELTHFAETDTDQVWQVWEGAWRIVYPPAALAANDGDPGTPWLVGATGVLTGSQNLVLDDGITDSPQLQLVGGSNDDTADILLDDSGVAGQSDLAINLPGTDANSVLNIRDQTAADKVHIDAEGSIFQFVYDAITNTYSTWQTLEHNSTGVPVAGFAGRILYRLEDGGGAMDDAAAMQVEWEDETSGSEDSLIRFYLRKAGVILGEFIRFAGEGIRTVVAGTDIFPNDDGRGFASRFVNPTGLTAWTAHFRPGETTGPGNGTLTGYAWQGAPLGGVPPVVSYSIFGDYFRGGGAAATKYFLSKAIANAAASWQGKSLYARVNVGITVETGLRFDAGDDNNWVELYMTGVLADATQRLDFRYRDNGGAINTVTSNLIVPVDSFIVIRLLCYYSAPNYSALGYVIAETGGTVNVTGFSHTLTGNWAAGPPTAGRAGIMVANAGNPGYVDWFYNEFT
jgi:hypothetical protein